MKQDFYIYKNGRLVRRNDTIALIAKNNVCTYIPIEQTNNIHIYGEVDINKRVLEKLSNYDITIVFHNYFGRVDGVYFPTSHKTGKILIEQVNTFNDLNKRNELIKTFIKCNIDNELSILHYYQKKENNVSDLIDKIVKINQDYKKERLDDEQYSNVSMLYEARIKQIYYEMFDRLLIRSNYSFNNRSKHPPLNEVNSALSYGYALLYSDVLVAIMHSKLTPEISFIHSNEKHGFSLHYDIADMIKPVYVDRIVLRMFRRKQFNDNDFESINNGIYLSSTGKEKLIREYNKHLTSTIYDSRSNRSYSYKQLLSREVYLLTDHILDKKKYKPYVLKV